MDGLLQLVSIWMLPAIVAPVCWILIKWITGSTKYSWAMSMAIGYCIGHISMKAWMLIPESDPATITAWSANLWPAFLSIAMPTTAIDWLPIGALLAAMLNVNFAAFPFRIVALTGSILISLWLALQLVNGTTVMPESTFNRDAGIRLAIGSLTLIICWLSVTRSIVGKSRWVWIGCVSATATGVAVVLATSGDSAMATLGIVVLSAMFGSILIGLPNKGTDNVRYSGAAIAVGSIGLLLVAWLSGVVPWYPLPLVVLALLAIWVKLPSFATGTAGRISLSAACSVAAVLVAVLVP